MIAQELEIPPLLVPRDRVGALRRGHAAQRPAARLRAHPTSRRFADARPRGGCAALVADDGRARARAQLRQEGIAEAARSRTRWPSTCATSSSTTRSPCPCRAEPIEAGDLGGDRRGLPRASTTGSTATSCAAEGTDLELINVRVRSHRPHREAGAAARSPRAGADADAGAQGHAARLRARARRLRGAAGLRRPRCCWPATVIPGPALIERADTTIFVSASLRRARWTAHRQLSPAPERRGGVRCMSRRQSIDKVLVSIIGRALKAITDEMSISMEKTTRSPILCEAKDFVTGLYDAEGRMLEQTENLPILCFSLSPVCKHIAETLRGRDLPRRRLLPQRRLHPGQPEQRRRRLQADLLSARSWWPGPPPRGTWPTSAARCAAATTRTPPRSGRRRCASRR